ncbi:MAG TPA: hypothetical protein G4O18_00765 [Dehalococcoidia bacterium]|nr:hypothetical protein [Dehalococcoidia bacterium]
MTTVSEHIKVEINEGRILRDVGYDTSCEPPARMKTLVHKYVQNASQLINPVYSYVIRDIDFVIGSNVFVEDGAIFQSRVISGLLKKCEQVAVFALTIDGYLEEAVSHLTDNGLVVHARVLDAIGSDAAEQVAKHVQHVVTQRAHALGLSTSRRFSPGYCDWDVDQQRMLFRSMNGSSAFIKLTDECLMIPQKSISGIIGIGASECGIESYNPCRTCCRHECPGRR